MVIIFIVKIELINIERNPEDFHSSFIVSSQNITILITKGGRT